MGILMFRCPATGHKVSTGMEIDRASFGCSPVFFRRTHCPICAVDHEWFAKDAWVTEAQESIGDVRKAPPASFAGT